VKLSVIIPVRDGGEAFARCLRGVRANEEQLDELIVVDDGSRDGSDAVAKAAGARVLRQHQALGPAQARNAGAAVACGDLLVFFDADTAPPPDTLARIRRRFEQEPDLDAVSGRYDDEPAAPGLVSRYRNLVHSFTHLCAAGPVATFWAGCGAVRRHVFAAAGGFDTRFGAPSVEDIEFGMRLANEGRRLVIDPAIQVKHLKRWTLWAMVRTDVWHRAVPWAHLMMSARQAPAALNLRWSQRASVLAVLAAPVAAFAHAGGAFALLGLHAGLNWRFFSYLCKRKGWGFALACWPLHVLHHFYSGLALPLALVTYPWRRLARPARPLREVAP
jgi:GT2 family glycosyltransferase